MCIPERLMRAQGVVTAMTMLQVLWLVSIWLTGAAANWQKLPLLLMYSLVCGVVVGFLPTRRMSRMRLLRTHLAEGEPLPIATLCLGVLLVGVVYTSLQLGWPDESRVFAAARIVAEQGVRRFFADYTQVPWLGFQHPPLVPLIYGFAMRVFGVHLVVLRLVSLLLSLVILLLTYRLGSTLYDRDTGILAALLLLAVPFFFRIGATALTDMPVTFCFVLALVLTLRLVQTPTYWLAGMVGLCIGVGLLCRYTMVFIYPVFFGCVIVAGSLRHLTRCLGIVMLVSTGILAAWLGYAASTDVLAAQRDTLTSYAGFVLTTDQGGKWLLGVLLLRLPSGVGVYNLPMLCLGGWQLIRRHNQSDLVVLLWISAVFLPLILTLPGPRYFLPAFPALAIVMACGVRQIEEAADRVVLLTLLYGGGALYLFVDWYRAAGNLFSR